MLTGKKFPAETQKWAGTLMWRTRQDPEMIVKTLSSKIRKGFAEGVSRGHQRCVTVILKIKRGPELTEIAGNAEEPFPGCVSDVNSRHAVVHVQFRKTTVSAKFYTCFICCSYSARSDCLEFYSQPEHLNSSVSPFIRVCIKYMSPIF